MKPFYTKINLVTVFLVQFLILESGAHGGVQKCLTKTGKFPIIDSCTSYFICENWKIVGEDKCESGDHFNPIKGECDWADSYPCTEKSRSKHCPKSNGRFVKEESECRKYFDCCDGKATEKTCPRSTLFDVEKGKCEWEELVACDRKPKRKECPKPNGRFVKPYSDCKKYFECRNGEPEEKRCPSNRLFNVKTGTCDWEELVSCGKGNSEESDESGESSLESTTSSIFDKITSTLKPNRKKCPELNGRFVKPYSDCRKYFECKNGQPYEKKCGRGLLFDAKTQMCEREKLVSCKEKRRECPEPNGQFLKPSSECRKYFKCKNGEPEEKRCGRGLLFNVKTQRCDPEKLVSCKQKDDNKESSSDESDESGESSSQPTTSSIFDRMTSTPKPKQKECPKPNGRFVKPYSECRKYFDCRNGQPTEKKCPSNQLFNVKSGKCEWKELVSCKKDDTSSETPSEESDESTSISDRVSSTSKPQTSIVTDIFSSSTTEHIVSQSTTESFTEESSSVFERTDSTLEESSSSFPITYSTLGESSSFRTTDKTSEESSSTFPTTDSTFAESSSSTPKTESTSDESSSSFQTTELSSEMSSNSFPTTDSTSEENTSRFPTTADSTSEENSSTFLTSDSTPEESSSSIFTTASSSEVSTSNFFTTDFISDESSSRVPITESTSEDISSSFLTTDFISEESSSRVPITESTSEDSSSSFVTSGSTSEPSSSRFYSTDFVADESSSSVPPTDLTPSEIATDGTSEDLDFSTKYSSTSIKHTSLTPSVRNIKSTTVETSSEGPLSTQSTTNFIEPSSSTKSTPETSTSDPVKDFVCPEATGYFPHPYDKHKFIGCVHYIPYEMVCPSNLVYDHKQQRCVYG